MTLDIPGSKLHNQLLSQTKFTQPDQVVAWLGAVQSQGYAGPSGPLLNGQRD